MASASRPRRGPLDRRGRRGALQLGGPDAIRGAAGRRSAPLREQTRRSDQLLAHVSVVADPSIASSTPAITLQWCRSQVQPPMLLHWCRLERSGVADDLIPDDDPPTGRAAPRLRQHPRPRAAHRRAGHARRACRPSWCGTGCSPPARRTTGNESRVRGAARGLHDALELNHAARTRPSSALDEVLARALRPPPVGRRRRSRRSGRGGRRGRLDPHRAGCSRGSRERGLVAAEDLRVRRVRVGLLRPVEEPVAPLLRVRLRQQAQDPRLPRPSSRRHLKRPLSRLGDLLLSRSIALSLCRLQCVRAGQRARSGGRSGCVGP